MPSIAILGSGNGSNAQAIINAIENGMIDAQIVCIISDVKDAPILKRAHKNNIPSHFIDCSPSPHALRDEAEKSVLALLKSYKAEYIILAGFLRIIKQSLLEKFPRRIINIHPSLLPAFKGLNTHRRALEMKVKFSGCTVHFVNKNIDSGKIIDQEVVKVCMHSPWAAGHMPP